MALTINGRFFANTLSGEPTDRRPLRIVTYGPFPPHTGLEDEAEFGSIAKSGFDGIRMYQPPTLRQLNLAHTHKLFIIATIPWSWDSLFTENLETVKDAHEQLRRFLRANGAHPALGALLIANEIRPDLVRMMGPLAVRSVLEDLIRSCHELSPSLPIAYANFPTTEYLEPRNADFSAFNVYLEKKENLSAYLRRLQNIAGDRPLLLSEFGVSTYEEGAPNRSSERLEKIQRNALLWAYESACEEALAGVTLYSWNDNWKNGGRTVTDWSFGLTRRDGSAKPALWALTEKFTTEENDDSVPPLLTIAICTRNGALRLKDNLPSYQKIRDPNFELIIIDDGSSDDTFSVCKRFQRETSLPVRIIQQKPSGLSVARNLAAKNSNATIIAYIDDDAHPHPDWLHYLRSTFARSEKIAAAGGPNLPPTATGLQNALVTACMGNVSHVLFDDTTAEHLPGCNLALNRNLLVEIGGFDEQFHAAGDDVDICWRLLDAGYELGFHAAACVFHDRRTSAKGFIRQQRGYGYAEALLYRKHPQRFGRAGIRWEGFIYNGSPLSPAPLSVIYSGPLGDAPYQMISNRLMPPRPLPDQWNTLTNRLLVRALEKWAQIARFRMRKAHGGPTPPRLKIHDNTKPEADQLFPLRRNYQSLLPSPRSLLISALIKQNWQTAHDQQPIEKLLDLTKDGHELLLAETPAPSGYPELHILLHSPTAGDKRSLLEIETQLTELGIIPK